MIKTETIKAKKNIKNEEIRVTATITKIATATVMMTKMIRTLIMIMIIIICNHIKKIGKIEQKEFK